MSSMTIVLISLQKPGVPLARGTLITHCYKDLGFMDFICTLVTKSIKVNPIHCLIPQYSLYVCSGIKHSASS